MNCGHCRDCKWWDDTPYIFGGVEQAERECYRADDSELMYTENPDTGLSAILFTVPDFGCVEFEAKV